MLLKEEWPILPAEREEVYAGLLPNTVYLIEGGIVRGTTHIQIPSALFEYLHNVHGVTPEEFSDETETYLFLSKLEDMAGYVFGISVSGRWDDIDLWLYKKRPLWAQPRWG